MLLMYYTSTKGWYFPDYAKNYTCNILHAYMYAHSKRLFDERPGDWVQDISRLQPQWKNMTFGDQSRYNIMFQKVFHKGGESAINYIKIFHNDKDLEISVGNSYTEDQVMHNLSYNLQQGVKYSAQIAIHQI